MDALLKKLNYTGQDPVLVLNAPEEFGVTMKRLADIASVHQSATNVPSCGFAICFASMQRDLDASIKALAPKLEGDAVLWIAYPKGSSKRPTCDFNRDTGWTQVGKAGFEPVRQVAIDDDWSALRFRRVAYIKKMTRTFAMTAEGKAKAKKGH
jgi:hypothetical protein